jgi:predicted NBD/HSP70 family sugar kinase
LETTAEWLVDLILETSDSAQGPLRQIVAALPGRVPTGTNRSGTPESREISVESLLQDSLEDRLTAPVIFESDASASLRGILQDDALALALALALDQSRLRESMLEARSEGHNP